MSWTGKLTAVGIGLVVTVVGAVLPAAAVSAGGATAAATPVLGAKSFAPHGAGFGHAHPSHVFNGGDPSGDILHVTWRDWGAHRSFGAGKNYIFKPKGGYYKEPVKIELRAQTLGHCTKGGRLAYTQLFTREPSKPHGKIGKWHRWSVKKTICHGLG